MPLRGGLRLSVFAMTCAVGLATASAASANEVVLWGCHSGTGLPLGAGPFDGVEQYGAGCATAAPEIAVGGLRATTNKDFTVIVRPNLTLKKVTLARRTSGLGSEGGVGRYSATFNGVEFDGSTTDVSGTVTKDINAAAHAGSLRFSVTGAGTAADFSRVGLRVEDNTLPYAAVGGVGSDAAGPMNVEVRATDLGVGLDRTELYIDGTHVDTQAYVEEDGRGEHCTDLTPDDGVVDLPIDNDCLPNGVEVLSVNTNNFPDGDHTVTVKLYDAAGNVFEPPSAKDRVVRITNHPDLGSSSAQLNIGSGNTQSPQGGNNNGGSGGVAGQTATSCNSPRLSMELSQKPERVSKGTPVLKYGKRYRFRGRLTCLVGTKRRSAVRTTPIQLLNTIGKKTYVKGGATVRTNGQITIILAYKSTRTLVFRYTNPDGRRSQVRMKVLVTKKP